MQKPPGHSVNGGTLKSCSRHRKGKGTAADAVAVVAQVAALTNVQDVGCRPVIGLPPKRGSRYPKKQSGFVAGLAARKSPSAGSKPTQARDPAGKAFPRISTGAVPTGPSRD